MKSKILPLKYPPILIGGKALEYYKLRKGRDVDLVIHKYDFDKLVKTYGKFKFPSNMTGVKVDDVDYFYNIGGIDYKYLKNKAIRAKNMLVASVADLILLKAITGYYEDPINDDVPPPSARKKAFADLFLLVQYGKF